MSEAATTVWAGDATGDVWTAFIAEMHSGRVFEVDEAMWYYWLEVLPPVWMRRAVNLPDGRRVGNTFGFAEGAENVVAFWREGGRFFGCQTVVMNPWMS